MTLGPRKEGVVVIFSHCTHQIYNESSFKGQGLIRAHRSRGYTHHGWEGEAAAYHEEAKRNKS